VSYPPVSGWRPPSATERKKILDGARTIAIVGASSKSSRASNFVITYLKSSACDYDLYPINPAESEILGIDVYPDLASIPVPIDIVDVFRRSEDCPDVARLAVEVGARVLWLQLGVWSVPAAEIALAAGLQVVMNRCTKIEHARFAGGLHLAGFNTGVISSRRAAPGRGPGAR
jgi:predicted CoA-binding protein